jgi:hypothetical protein
VFVVIRAGIYVQNVYNHLQICVLSLPDDHSPNLHCSKTSKSEWVGVVVLPKTCIQEMLVQITVRSWDIPTDFFIFFSVPSGKFQVSAHFNGGWDSVVSIVAYYRLEGLGFEFWWGQGFPCYPDQPHSPPSYRYYGYHVFFGGKAAGVWCWPPTTY